MPGSGGNVDPDELDEMEQTPSEVRGGRDWGVLLSIGLGLFLLLLPVVIWLCLAVL